MVINLFEELADKKQIKGSFDFTNKSLTYSLQGEVSAWLPHKRIKDNSTFVTDIPVQCLNPFYVSNLFL